jgi:fructokinase
MDIVCLGEVLIDMFPAEIGRSMIDVSAFRPKPGGAPANVAVAAAKLGVQSAFIGKVGEDIFGHYLQDILHAEGVDIRGVRFDPQARTTLVFIAMPDEHTAEFVFYRNPGADMLLAPGDLDRSLLASARAFHFGSISLIEEPSRSATLEAMRVARAAGALISFDFNYRPSLWRSPELAIKVAMSVLPEVNLLKVNEAEMSLLSGDEDLDKATAVLLDLGPDVCVVTMGPGGSYFRVGEGSAFVPAFPVHTVDATGCGDAFVAGLLCRLVKEGDWRDRISPPKLREILRYANAVGALTAQKQGVIPALPSAEQVNEFLDQLIPKGEI